MATVTGLTPSKIASLISEAIGQITPESIGAAPAGQGGGSSLPNFGTGKILVVQDFTTANTPRCTSSTDVCVRWRGPVQPTDMLAFDEWYVTE